MPAHPAALSRTRFRRMPPRSVVAPLRAAAVAVILVALAIPSVGGAQSSRDTTFAIARDASLEIIHESGSIRVRGVEAEMVRARSNDDDARFRVTGSSRSLRLSSSRRSGELMVDVPIGTRLLIRTRSGDLDVRNTAADVEIWSTSGDITVAAASEVRIESVTGDINVTDVADGLRLTTTSGDVTVDRVRGDVEVTGSSSEVSIIDAQSRRVAIKVLSGDIVFGGPLDEVGRYDFSSHSGDVRLQLPSDSRAAIDVQTYNGELSSSDLPLVLMPDLELREENETLAQMQRSRDSLEQQLRDSLGRAGESRPDRFRNRRDSLSFERNFERSVERLVESVLRNVGAQLESLSNSFDQNRDGRAGRITRVQLGAAGGPLVTISTFSGNVTLENRTINRSRRR